MEEELNYDQERYAFRVQWVDIDAAHIRTFLLHYFPADKTLELYDLKTNKIFLKRCVAPSIQERDLFESGKITIYGRLMTILEYADLRTKNKLCKKTQTAMAVIKPHGMLNIGGIIRSLHLAGFIILRCKMVVLTKEQALEFYKFRLAETHFPLLVENIIRGPVIAILVMGENAICTLREVMGPADPEEACKVAPQSIRAIYGKDIIVNAIHGSSNEDELKMNKEMFFPEVVNPGLQTCSEFNNSTLCVIKPHAIKEGIHGNIIHAIMECNFKISAMQMFDLDFPNAMEFLEVYSGVVPDYLKMVIQFSSGPCIAMEITTPDYNVETPQMFRRFVGPADPDLARQLRPTTLRARFGTTKIENAIHCTDLPEDGLLEVEYFFKVLQF